MDEELEEARRTIAQQAMEIERLQRQLGDARFAEELREALILGGTTRTIASPVSHSRLLQMIVETAAHVISARAAALFLIDVAAQELIFEVALGQKADEVKKFRVPLGHGIAGLVAVSGQPMAVSNAHADARQASDIAQKINYLPESILCVPLLYDDRVIGVLELLDKDGGASFGTEDMEVLSLFANQAAVAIEQSRTQERLAGLLRGLLSSLVDASESQRRWLQERGQIFAGHIEEESEEYQRALELARLVWEVARRGEAGTTLCRTILQGLVEYLRATREPTDILGGYAAGHQEGPR